MRSILEELRSIQPIELEEQAPGNSKEGRLIPASTTADWEMLEKAFSRIGKQQLRTNQQTELLIEELRASLEQAQSAIASLREQTDDYRRKVQRLEDDARESCTAALGIVDALDDLATIARQKGKLQWISRVDRLIARTLDALAEMGLTQVPTEELEFDERIHEIVDSVDSKERQPYEIVDVLRRGFRFRGSVLRRAQIVATR